MPITPTISLPRSTFFTKDDFWAICQQLKDLRIERQKNGNILLIPPTGSETGRINMRISSYLFIWNEIQKTGIVFDSSTGFELPDGSILSPDASWVKREKWESLTEEQRKKFAPLCPDFVVELMSENDSLQELQTKMLNWLDNGCLLAWLISPKDQKAYIYRQGKPHADEKDFTATLSGEQVLPQFMLKLQDLL